MLLKKTKIKYSIKIIVNSDFFDCEITLDNKPANIIQGNNSLVKLVEIEAINKHYLIVLKNNKTQCSKNIYISQNNQEFVLCN